MPNSPWFPELILHLDGDLPGAWNMALDQAWLEMQELPVLRVYGWSQPTVTLGFAQSLEKLAPTLPEWPVIRRWTGGGVVLHGQGDHTYSIIVPATHPWAQTSALESYRLIHGALVQAFLRLGLADCRQAEAEDLVTGPFCFVAPALHDVISSTEKLAGAGQRRGKIGFLHQGSIQNLTLPPDFWPHWASHLAEKVHLIEKAPHACLDRAQELVEKRFSLPQWLHEREDLLS